MTILRFLLVRVAVVAGMLLLAETLFRTGLWELAAKPESHAGTSVTLKQELQTLARPIDFVSLGSSRAQWGLDHALFAAEAVRVGATHVNLTMGGTHWMTFGVMVDWLRREHPEVKGGLLATSVPEILSVGNGTYELGIVYPFTRFDEIRWLATHVPFDQSDLSTYGAYSALFQYRADIQELLAHPRDRWNDLHSERLPASKWLFDLAPNPHNLCAVPTKTVAACASFQASNDADRLIANQCKGFGTPPETRLDLRTLLARDAPLPPEMTQIKELRSRQIRAIKWERRPIVVLMPVHRMLGDQFLPQGSHEWTLAILKPLVEEGVIDLLDYTTLFDGADGTDCRAFFDIYHQSAFGRAELMKKLLPEVKLRLYTAKEKDR
jgi:hypothetical protein